MEFKGVLQQCVFSNSPSTFKAETFKIQVLQMHLLLLYYSFTTMSISITQLENRTRSHLTTGTTSIQPFQSSGFKPGCISPDWAVFGKIFRDLVSLQHILRFILHLQSEFVHFPQKFLEHFTALTVRTRVPGTSCALQAHPNLSTSQFFVMPALPKCTLANLLLCSQFHPFLQFLLSRIEVWWCSDNFQPPPKLDINTHRGSGSTEPSQHLTPNTR